MAVRGKRKKVSLHKMRDRKRLVNMKEIKINVDRDKGKNKNIYKCPYIITLDSLHLPRHQTSRKGLVSF